MSDHLDSYLWDFLSQKQKDLIQEGRFLMDEIIKQHQFQFSDYSFIVFPFAKAYEGFLKQIFMDIHFISRLDYLSDHFRLGKVLSPSLKYKLGEKSVYRKIEDSAGSEFAERIWMTWKMGRNQVFHYFPHNLKSISFEEARAIIHEILLTMEESIRKLKVAGVKTRLEAHLTA
jgi:hypothetical protein